MMSVKSQGIWDPKNFQSSHYQWMTKETRNPGCPTGHLVCSAAWHPASHKHTLSQAAWQTIWAVISEDKPVPKINHWDPPKGNRLSLRTLCPMSAGSWVLSLPFGHLENSVMECCLELFCPDLLLQERAYMANIIKSMSLKEEKRVFSFSLTSIYCIMNAFPLWIKSVGLKLQDAAESREEPG